MLTPRGTRASRRREGEEWEEGGRCWGGGRGGSHLGLAGTWASRKVLSASRFSPGRASLGPGPVHPEGPQHPEGAAGGSTGVSPEGAEGVSHVEGDAASRGGGTLFGAVETLGRPLLRAVTCPVTLRWDDLTEASLKIKEKPGSLSE